MTEKSLSSIGLESKCPKYWVHGTCSQGHKFAKLVYCGREWCPVCGLQKSVAHLRRIARWLPKAFQIKSLGYFVFTIPLELRPEYRTKAELSALMQKATRLLKTMGYDRGLSRLHYFGDKSEVYNPHINILVDGGRITHTNLRKIKRAWASVLNTGRPVVVNYEYRTAPGGKYHILSYVTRATFINYSWNPKLAAELYNFRNTRYWGNWKDDAVWGLDKAVKVDFDTLIKFEEKRCPVCGHSLKWSKILPIELVGEQLADASLLAPGYYELE